MEYNYKKNLWMESDLTAMGKFDNGVSNLTKNYPFNYNEVAYGNLGAGNSADIWKNSE